MAVIVKKAVEEGDYASTSEVVRAALRDWNRKNQGVHNYRNLEGFPTNPI